MPTYQYKCPKCEATMTVSRSIHMDDPGYYCLDCNTKMNQVISNISVSFKGGGWGGSAS